MIKNKNILRKKYIEIRNNVSDYDYNIKSNLIFNNIIRFNNYIESKMIYTYISCRHEADTKQLIEYSFELNKKVAVPLCNDKNGNMSFYFIKSFSELENGTFGLYEPLKSCESAIYKKSYNPICIVPGLLFDKNGNRLGYGKGYYDRFLNKFDGPKIGICFNDFLVDNIDSQSHDIKLDFLITEKDIIKF